MQRPNLVLLAKFGQYLCTVVPWRQIAALKNNRRTSMCAHRPLLLLLVLAVVGIVLVQEALLSSVRNVYRNFYRDAIRRRISVRRSGGAIVGQHPEIAIITVLKNDTNYEEYRLAQQTFQCYAIHHSYRWLVVDLSTNATLQKLCPQKDFMFARHCVVVQMMPELSAQWIMFIDADMGVINPNHLIEEWLDWDVHLIFYDRIFNFEIMAGSYIVRNSEYGRMFLQYWANYEAHLPASFHGTDNGAIQNVFLELLMPEKVDERRRCERIWNASRNGEDLFVYEACARELFGWAPKWSGKVRVLGKGTAWARDTWLTNSMWCEQDFVLHGWQKRKMDAVMFASWPSPFTSHHINMSLCGTDEAGQNWSYKDTFMRSEDEIQAMLNATIGDADDYYGNALKAIDSYLKRG